MADDQGTTTASATNTTPQIRLGGPRSGFLLSASMLAVLAMPRNTPEQGALGEVHTDFGSPNFPEPYADLLQLPGELPKAGNVTGRLPFCFNGTETDPRLLDAEILASNPDLRAALLEWLTTNPKLQSLPFDPASLSVTDPTPITGSGASTANVIGAAVQRPNTPVITLPVKLPDDVAHIADADGNVTHVTVSNAKVLEHRGMLEELRHFAADVEGFPMHLIARLHHLFG